MPIATFNGRHNAVKSKILLTVLLNKEKENGSMSARQLADASGEDYDYLLTRLGLWTKWKYLIRHTKSGDIRPVYCYSIGKRGEDFIQYRIPSGKIEEYQAELAAYRAERSRKARARWAAIRAQREAESKAEREAEVAALHARLRVLIANPRKDT